VDCDAVGQHTARGNDAIVDEPKRPVVPDPEDRDLIAAGVDGQDIATIGRGLDRALIGQTAPSSGASGGERS
jgi:hypothetical protein